MLRRAVSVVLLFALVTPGCAAQQRRAVGQSVAGLGGLTMIAGIAVAGGCNVFDDSAAGETDDCEDDGLEPNPGGGLIVGGVGLAIMGIGGLIYATGK